MKEVIAFALITVCVVFIEEVMCSTEICYPIPRVVDNQKGQGEPGRPGKRGPAGPQGVKGEPGSCVCATEEFQSLRSQLQTVQGKVQYAELKTYRCVACLDLVKILDQLCPAHGPHRARTVTRGRRGDEAIPAKFFATLEKMCWTQFKTTGQKFKKFGPFLVNSLLPLVSQAGYGPAWGPVKGFVRPV